jgi:hypothetical protein
MTKHRWHDEIVAFVNGEDVERSYGLHVNWYPITSISDFAVEDGTEIYRIKPQPKHPKYLYVYERRGRETVEFYINHPHISEPLQLVGKIEVLNDD